MTDGATIVAAEELSYSIVRFVVHRSRAAVGRVKFDCCLATVGVWDEEDNSGQKPQSTVVRASED